MKSFLFCFCICILFFANESDAQKGMTTVGIQVKPIFPAGFPGTGKITNDVDGVHFETALSSGFSAGLVVRHNISKLIAFETGINYVKRKYSLLISDNNFSSNSTYRIISYEIPLLIMFYSQISEKLYVNGALGPGIDMFVSNIRTYDEYFVNTAFRNHIFQPGITGNAGVEYRTENSGNFYIGASYHRPFSYIYLSRVIYNGNTNGTGVLNELSGTYLTIDLRYFFPETKTKNVSE